MLFWRSWSGADVMLHRRPAGQLHALRQPGASCMILCIRGGDGWRQLHRPAKAAQYSASYVAEADRPLYFSSFRSLACPLLTTVEVDNKQQVFPFLGEHLASRCWHLFLSFSCPASLFPSTGNLTSKGYFVPSFFFCFLALFFNTTPSYYVRKPLVAV